MVPPLPPRKSTTSNTSPPDFRNMGLPPKYLKHLRLLLNQFLAHQLRPADEGLPGPSSKPYRQVWEGQRLEEIEKVLWDAIVLGNTPFRSEDDEIEDKEQRDSRGSGLINCDWEAWAKGGLKRKSLYRKQHPYLPISNTTSMEEGTKSKKGKEKVKSGSMSEHETARLGLFPFSSSTSTSNTPSKPTVTSVPPSPLPDTEDKTDEDVKEEEMKKWCEKIRGLVRFQELSEKDHNGDKDDPWQVLKDKPPKTPTKEPPGAFPQASSSFQTPSSYSSTSSLTSSINTHDPIPHSPAIQLPDILKLVFCMSFRSSSSQSPSRRSNSTSRFPRDSSASAESTKSGQTIGIAGDGNAGVAGGVGAVGGGIGGISEWIGNKWSEMTITQDSNQPISVEFIHGKFAFPSSSSSIMAERASRSSSLKRIRRKSQISKFGIPNKSAEGGSEQSDNDEEGSNWSGLTQKASRGKTRNIFVGGIQDDVPDDVAVGVVGGTFVIQGIREEWEVKGLEKVLSAMLYTIQSMILEISLLKAFRIPIEYPPPTPPKLSTKMTNTKLQHPSTSNGSLQRSKSQKERGTDKKSFFSKLGLESKGKGMFNGFLNRRRGSGPSIPSAFLAPQGISGATHNKYDNEDGGFSALGRPRISSLSNSQTPPLTPQSVTSSQLPSRIGSPDIPTNQTTGHTLGNGKRIDFLGKAPLHGIEKQLAILSELRNFKHSTTPDFEYALPPILLRVEEEDKIRREKAMEEYRTENGQSTVTHPIASSILGNPSSILGSMRRASLGPFDFSALKSESGKIDGLPHHAKRSSLSGKGVVEGGIGSLDEPGSITGTGSMGTMATLNDEIKGRATAYRLGGDVRSGINSLATHLDGWEGWQRLQKVEWLFWLGVEEDDSSEPSAEKPNRGEDSAKRENPPSQFAEEAKDEKVEAKSKNKKRKRMVACSKPETSCHRFYDPSSDISISEYLKELNEESGLASSPSTILLSVPGSPESRMKNVKTSSPGPSLSRSRSSSPPKPTPSRKNSNTPSVKDVGGAAESRARGEDWEDEAADAGWESLCSRIECGIAVRDHIRIWAMGGKTIEGRLKERRSGAMASTKLRNVFVEDKEMEMKLQEDSEKDGNGEKGKEARKNSIEVGLKCRKCGKEGEFEEMSEVAKEHSWNRFLELISHSQILIPPTFCDHSKSPSNFTYILRTATLTLSLAVKHQEMLNTRLPKMQVGSNVAKRKTGKEGAKLALEGIPKRGDAEDLKDGLKRDVEVWKSMIERRLEILKSKVPVKDEKSLSTEVTSLDSLQSSIEVIQASLFDIIDISEASMINDTRREILKRFKEVGKDLSTWMKENKMEESFQDAPIPRFEVVGDCGLVLPRGSIIVKEDEPGSVIAYTLSSLAYFNELCNANTKPLAGVEEPASSPDPNSETKAAKGKNHDDWTIEVKRKETPRDLLPLRTLNKKRSEAVIGTSRLTVPMPVTALQPSLELNIEPVTSAITRSTSAQGDRIDELVKNISKATAQDPILSTPSVQYTDSLPHSGHTSSTSLSETDSLVVEKRLPPTPNSGLTRDDNGAALQSSFRRVVSAAGNGTAIPKTAPSAWAFGTPPKSSTKESINTDSWGGSVTSTFSSSFNTILKFGSEVTDTFTRSAKTGESRSLASIMSGPFSSVSTDTSNTNNTGTLTSANQIPVDTRPHFNFTYTLPDKMVIGCTVYYASQFDTLRRRCAIDRSFIKSLSETVSWSADGGKSKASFWKTKDGRLVVKELVSKWNVSDMQALLDIAPAYFEHMAGTHNKATALTKIVGFYTVRIHDLKANEKRSMDLLVMENLFWKQDIQQTYDLKGIEGRRVPKGREGGGTLFDAEWLEAQCQSPLLLHPHAKRILLDSLATDTKFLSAQSVMDYSLLLGLDDERDELVVGIVDAVGSYGLFKDIEHRGKTALRRGREGEVTVIPPDQYRERFDHALKQYFISCPDKWSRSSKRNLLPGTDISPTVF